MTKRLVGLALIWILAAWLPPCTAGDKKLPRGALARLGTTQDDAKQAVTCVAVSPDNAIIATTSLDGTARLWDRTTGKPLHRLEHPTKAKERAVWGAVFSPDSKTLALAHERDGITLWDARAGKFQRHLKHEHPVYSVAFTPDGAFLAAESGDPEQIGLWDVQTGKRVRSFERFSTVSRSVAVSPNGRFLAATGKHTMHVWDLQENQLVLGLQKFDFAVTFSPGAVLMASANDSWVTVADPSSGRKLGEFRADGYARGWRSIAFSPDGVMLAGANVKRLRVWDVAGRRELIDYDGHAQPVTSIGFTPDGKALVSGSEDGTALVWDLGIVRDRNKPSPAATLLDILKDKDFLTAYGAFCHLRASPKETLKLLQKHLGPATKIPEDGFKQLMRDLDAPAFVVRKRAFDELKRYGLAAENALRVTRKNNSTLETVRRIDELLVLVEAEWPRSQWCVTLLEDLQEPPARDILTGLSKGDPDSRLTRVAAAALARLVKRSAK